jgi:hypothetical protein
MASSPAAARPRVFLPRYFSFLFVSAESILSGVVALSYVRWIDVWSGVAALLSEFIKF